MDNGTLAFEARGNARPLKDTKKELDAIIEQEAQNQPFCLGAVMPSLPLDVVDFIGRCNLYREKGKWYNEDGLFANSDVSLLQYIVELNQKK